MLYGPGADGDKERFLVMVDRRDIEREMRRLGDSVTSTVRLMRLLLVRLLLVCVYVCLIEST